MPAPHKKVNMKAAAKKISVQNHERAMVETDDSITDVESKPNTKHYVRLKWIEVLDLTTCKEAAGHGVEFYHTETGTKIGHDHMVAFLKGYSWLHGYPEVNEVYINKKSSKIFRNNKNNAKKILEEVRKMIVEVVSGQKVINGKTVKNIYMWFNA